MDWTTLALAAGLSFVTVLADSIIEKSTMLNSGKYLMVFIGGLIYALTAIGWYLVLKKTELMNAGVIYILFSLIFLAIIGTFYFNEKIEPIEFFGLFLAFVSIFILYRFTN